MPKTADAKEFDGIANKLEQFFSPDPGQGDDAMSEPGDDRGPTPLAESTAVRAISFVLAQRPDPNETGSPRH